jgi:3-hydroxybutyryl-CoA dehydrogenase
MHTNKVGVVGAGVMGAGVAQNLGQVELPVVLVDVSDEALCASQARIEEGVRLHNLLRREHAVNIADVLRHITFTTDYGCLSETEFVIENVPEKWSIKQAVYRQLDHICPPHCVFSSNTSAIPITRIAAETKRPGQVLGIHFMNPVPLKPFVEIIRGYHTTAQTLATAEQLLTRMGKRWTTVNDSPGFVSNRVLMLTINEAFFLLQEQVASAEAVDDIFKNCFGHKMGPFETADLIGLDTILYSLEVLCEEFNDDKYRPCPTLKRLVYAGQLGCKTGQGVYTYPK